jgi:hypothetical protein
MALLLTSVAQLLRSQIYIYVCMELRRMVGRRDRCTEQARLCAAVPTVYGWTRGFMPQCGADEGVLPA